MTSKTMTSGSWLNSDQPRVIETWTLSKLIDLYHDDKISQNPWYQRNVVGTKSWMRKILKSLWQGRGINTIHVRQLPDGTYEVLDGLQRIDCIIQYVVEKFAIEDGIFVPISGGVGVGFHLSGKKYEDLTEEQLAHFSKIRIAITVYKNMSDSDACEKFVELNNGNPLSDAEKRNGLKGYWASAIRGLVNPCELDIENGYRKHPIWEILTDTLNVNKTRQCEELVAKMFSIVKSIRKRNSLIFTLDKQQLDRDYDTTSRYQKEPEEANATTKHVVRILNEVKKIYQAQDKNRRLRKAVLTSQGRLLYLFQYIVYLELKDFRIVDTKKFSDSFFENLNELILNSKSDDPILYEADSKKGKMKFTDLMTKYINKQMVLKFKPLEEMMGMEKIPGLAVSSPRLFTTEQIIRKYNEQGGRCAISGEKISLDLCEGGHIISFKNGGTTKDDNLIVISAKINKKMSGLDLDEFMRDYGCDYPNHLCQDILERLAA